MQKLYLGIFFLWLAACAPTPTPTAIPVIPTEINTPISTETPIWFPPTEIPTEIPTIEVAPTENNRPGIGGELFVDNFDDATLWNETSNSGTNVSVIGNGINFVMSTPQRYLYSFRSQPILEDFYLELTANINLCEGDNEFGVLVRASVDPSFYRVAFNCEGNASVTLILPGSAQLVIPNEKFVFLPTNTPSSVKIGIWVKGDEISVFANDHYLFSIERARLYRGTIGLFARAIKEDAISVQFKELSVFSID
jgi:hypothetical protein